MQPLCLRNLHSVASPDTQLSAFSSLVPRPHPSTMHFAVCIPFSFHFGFSKKKKKKPGGLVIFNMGQIDELESYFEERWLNGPYPLKTWNYYQMEGPKTNNHVEEWHKKINCAAGKAHPNIFQLVELFKTEQANTEVCLAQLAAGGAVRSTRKK